jgi:hypothetical protein
MKIRLTLEDDERAELLGEISIKIVRRRSREEKQYLQRKLAEAIQEEIGLISDGLRCLSNTTTRVRCKVVS